MFFFCSRFFILYVCVFPVASDYFAKVCFAMSQESETKTRHGTIQKEQKSKSETQTKSSSESSSNPTYLLAAIKSHEP